MRRLLRGFWRPEFVIFLVVLLVVEACVDLFVILSYARP